MATTVLDLDLGEVYNLADSPTSLASGEKFLVQNLTTGQVRLSEQSMEPSDSDGPGFIILPTQTWGATMPSSGSVFVWSPDGARVAVGEA